MKNWKKPWKFRKNQEKSQKWSLGSQSQQDSNNETTLGVYHGIPMGKKILVILYPGAAWLAEKFSGCRRRPANFLGCTLGIWPPDDFFCLPVYGCYNPKSNLLCIRIWKHLLLYLNLIMLRTDWICNMFFCNMKFCNQK